MREINDIGVDKADGSMSLGGLLSKSVAMGASDLHLSVGAPPSVRIDGAIRPISEDLQPLTPSSCRGLIYSLLSEAQRERLEGDLELDLSCDVAGLSRFRVNVYAQKGNLGAAFRVIPHGIPRLEELGLPEAVSEMVDLPRGLVLVTGPTGSGKSTTLAAMIDRINTSREEHIMSVEDPIEFVHTHRRCLVNQREVGQDTRSFADALRHVLRQDPDVILVGEMRDLETVQLAITAAETGHMVFATLHTQDAPQTVDRMIDVFPPHQQQQIRAQLANALQGVITQTLVPRKRETGGGRIVAAEVMVATSGVRNMIREGKNYQIYSAMQTGSKAGMITMDASLASLVRRGEISREDALKRSSNPDEVSRMARNVPERESR